MAKEQCFVRGDLRVTVRCAKTGRTIRHIQLKNQITSRGLRALVDMFRQYANSPPSNYRFKEIRVGSGTTPPTRADTALVTPQATIQLLESSTEQSMLADPFEIRIVASLPATDANGVNLCEAAIGMANDEIFARQVHTPIAKTSAVIVDYDWRITFTA
ncbi:MAG: hypothetical protein ACRC8U_03865 [Brooklawnia sp.]